MVGSDWAKVVVVRARIKRSVRMGDCRRLFYGGRTRLGDERSTPLKKAIRVVPAAPSLRPLDDARGRVEPTHRMTPR